MWPVPLLIGVLLAPESPWWLVRKGRTDDAKKSLLRLTSLNKETDFDADETISMMVHTTALEEKVSCNYVWRLWNTTDNGIYRLPKALPTGIASKGLIDAELR
jgi:SP family general alpha glucoside:H+ symporter-like MFS transporter